MTAPRNQPEANRPTINQVNQAPPNPRFTELRQQIEQQQFEQAATTLANAVLSSNGEIPAADINRFISQDLTQDQRQALLNFLSGSANPRNQELRTRLQTLQQSVGGTPPSGPRADANSPSARILGFIDTFVSDSNVAALTNMLPAQVRQFVGAGQTDFIKSLLKSGAAGVIERIGASLKPFIGNQSMVPLYRTVMELRAGQMPAGPDRNRYMQSFADWSRNAVGEPPSPNGPVPVQPTLNAANTQANNPGTTPNTTPNAPANQTTETVAIGIPMSITAVPPNSAPNCVINRTSTGVTVEIGGITRRIDLPINNGVAPAISNILVAKPTEQNTAGRISIFIVGRANPIECTIQNLRNALNSNTPTVPAINPNMSPITLAPIQAV